jgi:hypothetical protein
VELPFRMKFSLSRKLSVYELPAISKWHNVVRYLPATSENLTKHMKQNPFSLYDFLGYLIPGSTLIYLFIIIENWTNNKVENNLESIFSYVSKYNFQEIFFFIIIFYAIGHLLSFISSVTIEKYGN